MGLCTTKTGASAGCDRPGAERMWGSAALPRSRKEVGLGSTKTGAFVSCDRLGAERMWGLAPLRRAPLPIVTAREPKGCGAWEH